MTTRQPNPVEVAYSVWRRRYQHIETDDLVQPFLIIDSVGPWLKRVREALYISQKVAGKQISHATFQHFERNEADGTITLNALRKAAEALNCELVYAIRPKQKKLFSEVIWQKLWPFAIKKQSIQKLSWYYKANAIAEIAHIVENDCEFRRLQSWSQKGTRPEWPALKEPNRNLVRELTAAK